MNETMNETMNEEVQKKRVILKGITAQVWEHPADRLALNALRKIPGLGKAIEYFIGNTTDESLRLSTLASAVRVSERQFPSIYRLHLQACEVLDIEQIPELYVSQSPFLNAGAMGVQKPIIVLNSSVLDIMEKDEVLHIIGHELAHVKSEHMLYKTLLIILLNISFFLKAIPFSQLILNGIIMGLKEWSRKSELSADRGALLTVQDPDISAQVVMKMAGGPRLNKMNMNEFVKQAEEYDATNSLGKGVQKFLNTMNLSHPFPVIRLLEQIRWIQSGRYDAIIGGDYGTEKHQDVKDARDGYMSDINQQFGGVYKKAKDMLDNAMAGSKK